MNPASCVNSCSRPNLTHTKKRDRPKLINKTFLIFFNNSVKKFIVCANKKRTLVYYQQEYAGTDLVLLTHFFEFWQKLSLIYIKEDK